jgi:hypothetical protein
VLHQESNNMTRSSVALLALLAALLITARPAHGDCYNDDEGADDDTSCPQVCCCLLTCDCWPARRFCLAGLPSAGAACKHVATVHAPVHSDSHSLTNCGPVHLQGCATGEVVIPRGQRCGGE